MRPFVLFAVLACLWPATSFAASGPPPTGKPSIRIISPANNATIVGSSVTVRVTVKNFRLVPPVLVGPNHWHQIPLLKGNQGHIHYLLDGESNLVLTRDVVTKLSHTWTNVAPGRHSITAYLANSQHAAFPGAAPSVINLTLKPAIHTQTPLADTPSIAITNHIVQQTSAGTRLLVRVRVSHFKLVAPVYKNPPMLPPTEGHIHYALDSVSNFIATKDATTSLSHPWTGVTPGRHTLIVYLATSQHQQVPGTRAATLSLTIPAGKGPHGRTSLYVGTLPRTGGAMAPTRSSGTGSILPLLTCLTGLILVGLAFLRRRQPAG